MKERSNVLEQVAQVPNERLRHCGLSQSSKRRKLVIGPDATQGLFVTRAPEMHDLRQRRCPINQLRLIYDVGQMTLPGSLPWIPRRSPPILSGFASGGQVRQFPKFDNFLPREPLTHSVVDSFGPALTTADQVDALRLRDSCIMVRSFSQLRRNARRSWTEQPGDTSVTSPFLKRTPFVGQPKPVEWSVEIKQA